MDVKVVYSNNKHDWHDELNDDDEYGAVVVDGWQMDWEYLEDFDYLIPIVRNSIAALDKAQVYLIVQMNSHKYSGHAVATDYVLKKLQSEV